MRARDLTITFRPVADGTQWDVLIEVETLTLHRVLVDHDVLNHINTLDANGLGEKIETRALDLFAQGDATQIAGPKPSTEVLHWVPLDRADAQHALTYHLGRYTREADDLAGNTPPATT